MIHKLLRKGYLFCLAILILSLDFRTRFTPNKNDLPAANSAITKVTAFSLPTRKIYYKREGKSGLSFFRKQSVWNPSLIAYEDRYLMFFRLTQFYFDLPSFNPFTWERCKEYRDIHGIWLDKDLNPVSEHFAVDFTFQDGSPISCPEDPRFIELDGKLYCLFNHYFTKEGKDHNQMFLSEIYIDDYTVFSTPSHHLKHPTKNERREKNWMPFTHGNNLYVVYKSEPFEVLEIDTKDCQLYSIESNPTSFTWIDPFISGSTPAIDYHGDKLAIIHSFERTKPLLWKTHLTSIYSFGAMLFSADEMRIKKHSKEAIMHPLFYTERHNRSKILFPSALIKTSPGEGLIAMGLGDKETLFVHFDLDILVNEMQPL